MEGKNMFFSLVDADISSKKETSVTYDELLEQVNSKAESLPQDDMDLYSDLYFAEVLDYKDNYTKKQLETIAHYYSLSTRKKRKTDMIQDIILFENDPTNETITNKRKLMWFYLNELNNDRFLKKYIIFN